MGRRLCEAISGLAMEHADSTERVVTLSIGGVTSVGGVPAELLRRVDAALYAAKAAGRNRFIAASAPSVL